MPNEPDGEEGSTSSAPLSEQSGADRERSLSDMPYANFLAERQRIVDARQRAQQRFDQIVSTGSAAALVFSITFIEKLSPAPDPSTRLILIGAWGFLLLSLGCNFASHIFSQQAFDSYLSEFDKAYCDSTPCNHESGSSTTSRRLDWASAAAFVLGVLLLAFFSISNLTFERPNDANSGSSSREAIRPTAEAPAPAATAAPAGSVSSPTPRSTQGN